MTKSKSFLNSFFFLLIFFVGIGSFIPDQAYSQKKEKRANTKKKKERYIRTEAVEITGTVYDILTNKPVHDTYIMVENTDVWTVTDRKGRYKIIAPAKTRRLFFSFLGYQKQSIPIGRKTKIDVYFVEDNISIDEIIVTGYETAPKNKRELPVSIEKISSKLINNQPYTPDVLLQGMASGVNVTSGSGALSDAGAKVNIRGINSINMATEPLYVIDGVPYISPENYTGGFTDSENYTSPLSELNKWDIQSVSILKDAASTAIYGMHGSNGVVIVKTKSAQNQSGKGSIGFNYSLGWMHPKKVIELADAKEWNKIRIQSAKNSGVAARLPYSFDTRGIQQDAHDISSEMIDTVSTDWYDKVMKNGFYHNAGLSFSGGNNLAKYYISGNYKKEDGTYLGSAEEQFKARLKLKYAPNKRLRANLSSNIMSSKVDNINMRTSRNSSSTIGRRNYGGRGGFQGIYTNALPVLPVYAPDGNYFDPYSGRNLLWAANRDNYDNDMTTFSSMISGNLIYIIAKGFTVTTRASLNFKNNEQLIWIDENIRIHGGDNFTPENRVTLTKRANTNRTFQTVLNYKKEFKDHAIQVLAGFDLQKFTSNMSFSDYGNLLTGQKHLGDATEATPYRIYAFVSDIHNMAFFTKINYAFRKRYLLQLVYRRDGSSSFAPGNRYADFPAAAAGWIITKEDFMKDIKWLNYLKLSANFGLTGNTKVPPNNWSSAYQNLGSYGSSEGYVLTKIGNKDLTWEQTTKADAVLHYGIFNDRLRGSVGYYYQQISNLLVRFPIAPSIGVYEEGRTQGAFGNVGTLQNQGVEFNILVKNLSAESFKWTTSFNFTIARNKVIYLHDIIESPTQISYREMTSVWEDKQFNVFYLAEYAGLDDEGFETVYEIDIEKYEGSNGTITEKTGNRVRATVQNVRNNRIFHDDKTGLPTYFGGLHNDLRYKRLSFSFLFTFQGGNYIYDLTATSLNYINNGNNVLRKDIYNNSWTPENTDADYAVLVWRNKDYENTPLSHEHTKYLEKGDFLKLKNVKLSYNFTSKALKKIKLKKLGIYIQANEILTFSRFKSFDPELVNFGDGTPKTRNLGQGFVRMVPFPRTLIISAGLKMNL